MSKTECYYCKMTNEELLADTYSVDEAEIVKVETICSTDEDDNAGEQKEIHLCGNCRKCSRCCKIISPNTECEENEFYTCCLCWDQPTIHCYDCENIDSPLVWCSICKEHSYDDETCAHLYLTIDREIQGAGCCDPKDNHLEPYFFEFLSFMGLRFAVDLRLAIKNGKTPYDFIYSYPSFNDKETLIVYEYNRDRIGDFEAHCDNRKEENEYDGYYLYGCYEWIITLDDATKKANEETIDLIDKWIFNHEVLN